MVIMTTYRVILHKVHQSCLLRSYMSSTRKRKIDLYGWAGISAVGLVRLMHSADAHSTLEGREDAQTGREKCLNFSCLKIWIFLSSPVMTHSGAAWLPWVPFSFLSAKTFQGSGCACHPVSGQAVSSSGPPHHIVAPPLPQASQPYLIHPYQGMLAKAVPQDLRCLTTLAKLTLTLPVVFKRPPHSSLFLISTLISWHPQLRPKPRELPSILDLDMLKRE